MAVADFYSLHEDDDIADGFRGFDFREDDYEVELEDTCLLEVDFWTKEERVWNTKRRSRRPGGGGFDVDVPPAYTGMA